jgi:hypothetical protein
MAEQPRIHVVEGNIAELPVDVVALKYAQAYYGADRLVASLLAEAGEDPTHLRPRAGGYRLLSSRGVVSAEKVLFVGVPLLVDFGYREIREFARRVLTALAVEAPGTRSIAATLHGPGYGFDEIEAFESEVAGFLDALRSGDFPSGLDEITIAERNPGRCRRLKKVLNELVPQGERKAGVIDIAEAREERLRAAGYASDAKAHVFVAMPFKEEMDDVYHYGIQGAVRDAGFLCEPADLAAFTGDVLQWVRERIKTSALLVADLSDANPNVYLEVGYAWGCGIPTVLLVRENPERLRFDVRGQRCLVYKRIKDLEESLRNELQSLHTAGALEDRI